MANGKWLNGFGVLGRFALWENIDIMVVFELAKLLQEHQARGDDWSEFLRVPALSVGLYTLPAGAVDPQQPHTEDEVYYVLGGQATIRVGDKDQAVGAGSIIYVGAGVEHRFFGIKDDLTVLVFFAPAEGSLEARELGDYRHA